jgi:sodium/hydrogen exchanger 8
VFAYLGLALFSFPLSIQPSFIIWSIVLCLLGRAANIYPLAYLCNYFREHKISKKMMFIMWFSGMRGAVAYALALHLEMDQEEKKHVMVTTTLIIVLFTVILLGGLTMPMVKFMKADNHSRKAGKKRRAKKITLSKTKEMGQAIEAEHLSEYTEEELDPNIRPHAGGFVRFDLKFLMPFFLRRFTEEVSASFHLQFAFRSHHITRSNHFLFPLSPVTGSKRRNDRFD